MDFADAPEHAAFRREFRDWLDANLTEDLKVEDAQDQRVSPDRETLEKRRVWQKKMGNPSSEHMAKAISNIAGNAHSNAVADTTMSSVRLAALPG